MGLRGVTRRESGIDKRRRRWEREDAFAAEKRGISRGMLGGAGMMAIAAVWFFGGLIAGMVFFYPPVLFVIGLYAFLKGLFTGNVAGKTVKRRRRRNHVSEDLPSADDERFARGESEHDQAQAGR